MRSDYDSRTTPPNEPDTSHQNEPVKPELLPYVSAFVAILLFCLCRQVLRNLFGLRAANLLGATAAGICYYGFFLYRDELPAGNRIPEGTLPAAVILIMVLLAVAALFSRRPQSPNQNPATTQRPTLRSPGESVGPSPEPPARDHAERRFRRFYPDDRYVDDERSERRFRRYYSDDRYPDDDRFRER